MARRYDDEGYRSDGRRQILGYSRAVQGGADQARARAEQRLAMARDPSLAASMRRSRRVAEAKAEGSFDSIREEYNKDTTSPHKMDSAGNIVKGVNVGYTGSTSYTPKPARSTPMSFKRPVDQGSTADTVAMTTPEGLLDMARKARTYVRRTKL